MRIDTDKIREGRLRRAWTQEQLAAVAGLGLRTVQRIERSGQASPESVQALAAVLELSPDELFRPAAPEAAFPSLPDSEALVPARQVSPALESALMETRLSRCLLDLLLMRGRGNQFGKAGSPRFPVAECLVLVAGC